MNKPRANKLKLTLAAILLLAMAMASILLAAIFAGGFAGGSAGGTLSTGRNVMAHSDSLSLSKVFSSDTATIETAGMTIVVQPSSLIVDGTTVAFIDKDVSDVQVKVKQGLVTFEADGKPVQTAVR